MVIKVAEKVYVVAVTTFTWFEEKFNDWSGQWIVTQPIPNIFAQGLCSWRRIWQMPDGDGHLSDLKFPT